MRVSDQENENRAASEISKMQEISAKYGISTNTLKLINKKKQAQDVALDTTQQIISKESYTSRIVQL
jgi:DNA-binding Xre family transcriptional regulator